MSMIDSSIVTVALSPISVSFHSTLTAVQWVASAYLLSLGITLTLIADGAKRFGTRHLYLISLTGFTVTSALCALSPSLEWLIGLRVVQGLFGGAMVPLAMNMLFGGSDASKKMPVAAGMVLFLAPAIAPALGGILIQWAGWPLIFLVNVPVGFIAVMGAMHIPAELSPESRGTLQTFDVRGFVLLAAGLTGVTYGAIQGQNLGWLANAVWPMWAGGVLVLGCYGFLAWRQPHPVLDLGLLRNWQPRLALILSAVVSVVTFAVIFLVPIFMQSVQGRSPLIAGLALLPQGVVTGIGAVIGNALPKRWGVRWTARVGMGLLTGGTLALLMVAVTSSPWLIALTLIGRGFAIGLVIQPLLNRVMEVLPQEKVPDGTTLFNIIERLGGTVGIGLLIGYFTLREKWEVSTVAHAHHLSSRLVEAGLVRSPHVSSEVVRLLANAETVGFHDVIWLIAVLSILGMVLTVFIQ